MAQYTLAKIRKSNELTQANFSDFNLSVYRVFLNIISKIQKHDLNGNLIPLSLISRNCSLSASEYAKEFHIHENNAYAILKFAVDKLLKTSFTLPISAGLLKINVCAQALYIKDSGKIDIRFTEEIMPHLAAVSQKFTMFNLREITGFDSIYTTRFYELLMQWKTTGSLIISVSELRHALGCVNIFTRYNDFKRKSFGHAVNEINSQFHIGITFEEIKSGKTITSLIFTFIPTQIYQKYDVVTKKIRTQLIRPQKIKQKNVAKTKQKSQLPARSLPILPNEVLPSESIVLKEIHKEILPIKQTENSNSQKRKKIFGLF